MTLDPVGLTELTIPGRVQRIVLFLSFSMKKSNRFELGRENVFLLTSQVRWKVHTQECYL